MAIIKIGYPKRGKFSKYHNEQMNCPRKIIDRECTIFHECKDGICYSVLWDGTLNRKMIAKVFIDILN